MAKLSLLFLALNLMRWTICMAKDVLVLMEAPVMQWTHSQYLEDLKEHGHSLQIHTPERGIVQIASSGQNLFDALIVFANDLGKFKGVSVKDLNDFFDRGGNLLVSVDRDVSTTMIDLAAKFGVELQSQGKVVIDYSHPVELYKNDPTTFLTDRIIDEPAFVGKQVAGTSIAYKGIGMSLLSSSDLMSALVTASPTAYSFFAEKELDATSVLSGENIVLVSAVQGRNNARFVFAGSTSMFSDEFMDLVIPVDERGEDIDTGNKYLCREITQWALQEKSVLRATNFHHNMVGGEKQSMYRIKDEVEFTAFIEEYSEGKWQPFRGNDVQVEYVMMDPYVRKTMQHDGKGNFHVQMKLPDVYGVFKFRVDYHHPGLSWIKYTERVPARPYKHNEYERFIFSAYPYYVSAFSTMVCFFMLGIVFLYNKDDK